MFLPEQIGTQNTIVLICLKKKSKKLKTKAKFKICMATNFRFKILLNLIFGELLWVEFFEISEFFVVDDEFIAHIET